MSELLNVKGLSVSFYNGSAEAEALRNVSFTVCNGETLGLVGETGAGKTTLAKSLLRLIDSNCIKSGELLYKGSDILSLDKRALLRLRGGEIALIPQDPMSALDPVFTIGDQVTEAILLHEKLNKSDALERAAIMLETVGIPRDRFFDYPHQFSGGMKQRVVIATAIACRPAPSLLLADEPTTALDVTIQAQVLRLLARLKAQYGMSMLLITHDLGVVAKCADRVAIMYAGEIVELGDKSDIFLHPMHPYTRGLFASLPTLDGRRTRLVPIPGSPPDPTRFSGGCAFAPRCALSADCPYQNAPAPLIETHNGHFTRCARRE
jgi:peptide/nickel transport system ATP-binding protein